MMSICKIQLVYTNWAYATWYCYCAIKYDGRNSTGVVVGPNSVHGSNWSNLGVASQKQKNVVLTKHRQKQQSLGIKC